MRLFLILMTNLVLLACAGMSRANDDRGTLPLLPVKEGDARVTTVKGPSGEPAVQVLGQEHARERTEILTVQNPAVSSHQYLVRGKVKYEGVVDKCYLELLNNFGDKGEFFTRTLADAGPMSRITGTSDWRDFELPFTAEPGMRPQRLSLNVFLKGAGKISVTQPTLTAMKASSSWWSEPQAGWLGGILGTSLGLLGAFIGYASSNRRLNHLVSRSAWLGVALSTALLISGGIALLARQPWHVCYPLLLVGVIGSAVLGAQLPGILRRPQAEELRRMEAFDA